jgi:hypothetical protein
MEWVKASGVPLLAVGVSGMSVLVVAVFSFWQVRIAREKLRHDLYDRRFAIYMAFHELLVAVVEKDNVDAELRKAIAAWAHSPFLLDAKLGDYLVELHKEAFRIVSCLSWKWRKGSSVKITERTYEEGTEAFHPGRKSSYPEAASCG